MFSIANLSSAPSALPPVNVHPHGHRRGSHVESADDSSSDTAAQVPPGAAQNLFGSLLQSLEQVIGVQSTTAAPTATAMPITAASATATPASAATTAASAGTAVSSSSTLLQNYLNNLSQSLQANGSQAAKLAGPNLRINA
jgi:BRCT domain type II-containing protein